jgi:hypothetical protein
MLSLELPAVREFQIVKRYRETYDNVVNHVKIQGLDRYNYSSLHGKEGISESLTRQDALDKC